MSAQRILNVNDHEATRYGLSRALKAAGYSVLEAEDGRSALERLREQPDLILLDVHLPDVDGFELAQRIRTLSAPGWIPIVHISSVYVQSHEVVRGLEGGADAYLVSPIDPTVLVATLKALLRAKHEREARVEVEVMAAELALRRDELTAMNLALQREVQERKHAEALVEGHNRLLEMLACGTPLTDVLIAVCRQIEQQLPGRHCAVSLVSDGGTQLRLVAAPTLPEAYVVVAARGLTIGPQNGCCGTAVYRRAVVEVADIATDPLCEGCRELAGSHGFHAGWSQPLVDSTGEIVGSLAVLGREVGLPDPRQRDLIGRFCQLAAMAIERERAAEERRNSEERYRLIVETSWEGIWTVDRDGRITYVNRRMADLLGYTREEILGRAKLDFVPPQDHEARGAAWARRQRGVAEQDEVRLRHKDGSDVWTLCSISPAYDPNGEFAGALSMHMDITEQKRLEGQLHQAQKLEALGRLAGGVAHDFNNMLAIINGYAAMLLAPGSRGLSISEGLQNIAKAGNRAAGLTRQLLAFSRRQHLEPRVLDLAAIIDEMSDMLRRVIGEHIELRQECRPGVGLVRVDPSQAEQCLLNLVVNARDAMPHGGRVTMELSGVELREGLLVVGGDIPPGSYVVLSVRDTGCGIGADALSRIFDPFFSTKGENGTGLGLSTVYGIVKQSGGHIHVVSEEGAGATFELYFPRCEQPVEPADLPESVDPGTGNETILLVEDEDMVRGLLMAVLPSLGYSVLQAADGPQALRVAAQHAGPIHLLLTDVVMPGGMSGSDVSRELTILRPEMRTLYMSGYTEDSAVRQEVVRQGAALLHKPFSTTALGSRIREVLS